LNLSGEFGETGTMNRKRLVQFGAGNIGRSFMGRIFGTGGWEVVFVDIDRELIDRLNRDRRYQIIIKENNVPDREILVPNVRGILSGDTQTVVREIAAADLVATSVGKKMLPSITPVIAKGIEARFASDSSSRPINIILAENIHHGAVFMTEELIRHLPAGFRLEGRVGMIETSIGKMVPIMSKETVKNNPTIIYSEGYNSLIIDSAAYLGQIPSIPDLDAVDPITAYVDRKLYIHNLGHAAVSYFGNLLLPKAGYLYEVLSNSIVRMRVRTVMHQAADALLAEYPDVFSHPVLEEYIDDLLKRFQNAALGDTVYRVGRDLPRKLNRNDRVLGAARICVSHNLPYNEILEVFRAAIRFQAVDEAGLPYSDDVLFKETIAHDGLACALVTLCGLDPADRLDSILIKDLLSR
jgi:mannitol-1-phosphate 5-dehydrogenase